MSPRGIAAGAVTAALGLFAALSLSTGVFGPAGDALSDVLSSLLGWAAWGLILVIAVASVSMVRSRAFGALRATGDVALVLASASLLHIAIDAGGAIGELLGEGVASLFSVPGACIVFIALIAAIVATRVPNALSHLSRLASHIVEIAKSVARRGSGSPSGGQGPTHSPVKIDDAVIVEGERLVAPAQAQFKVNVTPSIEIPKNRTATQSFGLPSSDLFSRTPASHSTNEGQLHEEAEALIAALAAYNVEAKAHGVVPGPVVSTFEVSIAAGTKFSKVAGLAEDLSLQFGRKVRVVPSRLGRVGFEVQNESRGAVGIRELLEDPGFAQASKAMSLPVAIGRDVRGAAVFADLAAMPHLIVAGSTGSGKSVAVNALLASLLMARTPEELRLVLVDPKVVELAPYNGIPHLLTPSISDVPSAKNALGWCVNEMERRYGLLGAAGCKNIRSYNEKNAAAKLPFIVVIVDELADLMMQDKKGVEPLIVRLGQKARACGMHVIVATQRPSADIVTGLLKSNFPSRLAFRVASGVDSHVVLDEQGAEQLLGKGDALLKTADTDAAVRVQAPWVSEAEVDALCEHLRSQGPTRYEAGLLESPAVEEPEVKISKSGKAEGTVWS
jgi:S-DNA-T family DNA segregation ATPase FtsK/SpoIIIE